MALTSKLEQYLITTHRSKEPLVRSAIQVGARKYVSQGKRNCDMLPGLLDLPSASLPPIFVERLLKIWALFFERIIIPDGWLHCKGPLSEYLRAEYRASQTSSVAGGPETFDGNTLLRLMREGIVVPGLRGRRPATTTDKVRGFDIHRVWSGQVMDTDKKPLSLGVFFTNPEQRMAILDPTDENESILRAVAAATRTFVDWTSPDVPVEAIGLDDTSELAAWDEQFSGEVFNSILYDDLSRVRDADVLEINAFLQLPDADLDRLTKFYDDLLGRVQQLKANSSNIRRGTLERVVAQSFGMTRLTGYEDLSQIEHDPRELALNRFASGTTGAPTTVAPRLMLTESLLSTTTTVQEALFSAKFNCSPSMPRGFVDSVYHGGLAQRAGLENDVESFAYEEVLLWESSIAFETLSVDNIVNLRKSHPDYFAAASNCRPARHFWRENAYLQRELTSYLKDISAKTPVTGTAYRGIDMMAGEFGAQFGDAVKGFAGEFGAGILLPSFGPLAIWLAKRTVSRTSKILSAKLGTETKKLVAPNLRQGRCFATLKLLGIPSEAGRTDRRPG